MKIGLICSHGGHLTETLQLLSAFEGHTLFFATYHSPREEEVRCIAPAYCIDNIGASPMRLFRAFFWAYQILRRERPDVLVSLGAEIALPFFFLARLFKVRTIFIESWCRVTDLSKTGRLVYPVSDEFWVQWPQLAGSAGTKAHYKGAVI